MPNSKLIMDYFDQDTFYKSVLGSMDFLSKERAAKVLYIRWIQGNKIEKEKFDNYLKIAHI